MKRLIKSWKYPFILLLGIGVSNIGAWVYLIALNLIVFDITGSPLAVAVLYILIPMATLVTNFWSGSLIDRLNKRNVMICLDLFRALCIFLIPFLIFHSIWLVYLIVFLINMASSMFAPTSMTYITKLIPPEQRKRFNSLRSLMDSGAFLIGPAIAGLLFIIGTPIVAIYMNAVALFLSGLITLFMPNVEKKNVTPENDKVLSLDILKKDLLVVVDFSRKNIYIMLIYFLFSSVMVMTAAVDSLEAAFAKEVLYLSDSEYGFLVSVAGVGIVIGAFINTLFVKKISLPLLIGLGSIFVSVGYLIYAFSSSFHIAALGFFVLAFFLAFANTGFLTFYQNNFPVEVMGRIGSLYSLIQAILVIITTVLFGVVAQIISIQVAVILGTLIMFLLAVSLSIGSFQPSKIKYNQPPNMEPVKTN
ncbi:MFS transporter [Evansella tamaricis]|uniref:MFS transporter n=1 Tax=Evansella tamaricis TaxID=2069301 RepID=A0ABS6JCE1_9BACI|nr:MFS transporter [Evansella tamaricis]MBU9711346.1 MFS transporter [Evansella tamaricis]